MTLTLKTAQAIVLGHPSLSDVHRGGYRFHKDSYLPAIERLSASKQRRHKRLAAQAFTMVGDVHDLNGTPKAAVRAYNKSLQLWVRNADAWHSIGCMLDNMGRFKQARHAMRRAAKLRPDDELIAGDVERVEWAMLNPCPVLYEERSGLWRAAEDLAAGRHRKALAGVAKKRTISARQARARIRAVRGETALAVREWEGIAAATGTVQLQHADWFYTFVGPVGAEANLWRIMLWKLRSRLEGGAFHYPPSLAEIELPHGKHFELYVRYQLARCEGDVRALIALAGKYPSWREPGEAALRLK